MLNSMGPKTLPRKHEIKKCAKVKNFQAEKR